MKLDSPPAENPFEQLTDFQVRCLAHVANREDKTYVCLSGEPGSPEENDRNLVFNSFLRLIQLRFFIEMDRDNENYARMLRQFDQKGIALVMAEMTNRGQWMWEQVPWEKQVN